MERRLRLSKGVAALLSARLGLGPQGLCSLLSGASLTQGQGCNWIMQELGRSPTWDCPSSSGNRSQGFYAETEIRVTELGKQSVCETGGGGGSSLLKVKGLLY